MNRQSSQIKSLLDAWDILMRFRWRFILPAFMVTMLVLAASLMLPRKYEAEAIFERRTDMVLNEIMSRGGSPVIQRPQSSLNQQLAGSPAIDKLIKQLESQLKDPQEAYNGDVNLNLLRGQLERLVMVKYDISSATLDRVRVNYVSHDPVVARLVVNGLVTNYIEKTRAEINDKLQESARFFEVEVARCRAAIEKIENEKLLYEIKHSNLLPDSPNNVQMSMTEAQASLAEAKQKLEAAQLRVKALTQRLQSTEEITPSIVTEPNPKLVKLQARQNELNETLNQYVNVYRMKAKHPDLVQLREDITKVAAQILMTPPTVVTQQRMDRNPQYDELQLMLTQAQVEVENYSAAVKQSRATLGSLENQSDMFFPVRAEYRKISRDVEQQQRQLTFWEDNLRRVQMAMTAESGNRGILLDFIKPCEPISLPVSPNLIQVFMAAIMLGVAAGGVNVIAAYRADESFHEGDLLANHFQLPLMGAVSELISRRQRRMRKLRQVVLYPAGIVVMAGVLAVLGGVVYVSLRHPRAMTANLPEEIRSHLPGAAFVPQLQREDEQAEPSKQLSMADRMTSHKD